MLRASVDVMIFMGARRVLFSSSILAANKSLRIFSITKMAATRSQCAMLNGQYWVFKIERQSALGFLAPKLCDHSPRDDVRLAVEVRFRSTKFLDEFKLLRREIKLWELASRGRTRD